MNNFPLNVV